jgi:hypothetical protein
MRREIAHQVPHDRQLSVRHPPVPAWPRQLPIAVIERPSINIGRPSCVVRNSGTTVMAVRVRTVRAISNAPAPSTTGVGWRGEEHPLEAVDERLFASCGSVSVGLLQGSPTMISVTDFILIGARPGVLLHHG